MLLLRRIALSVPLLACLAMGPARAEPVVIDEAAARSLVAAAENAIASIERELARIPPNVTPKGLKNATGKAKASVADLKALIQRAQAPAPCPEVVPAAPTGPDAKPALEADRFATLVTTLKATTFARDRETALRTALVDRGLTVAQTVETLNIASFASDRLKFLEIIAPRPIDLNDTNKATILALFNFAADRTRAEALLAR